MNLFLDEIVLILEALKNENGRAKYRHFQAGLAIHGHSRQAIAYRDERMLEDWNVLKRKAIITRLEQYQIQINCEKGEKEVKNDV